MDRPFIFAAETDAPRGSGAYRFQYSLILVVPGIRRAVG